MDYFGHKYGLRSLSETQVMDLLFGMKQAYATELRVRYESGRRDDAGHPALSFRAGYSIYLSEWLRSEMMVVLFWGSQHWILSWT